ncbi:AsmA protein [Methylobacterium sp. NMS14P]|uniref:AsmA-like C-terminal region-containing protein n=1 Tax=Methylobacterium sp. NMS14P TaxID=2894310 RepID=UPI00235A073B|nr:AsmA-like C-terminal region-containing protein [Methylobacterium sp. NMS14P]WCS24646.1 AsmA protein [Methylobacterium sp. NMS14P]
MRDLLTALACAVILVLVAALAVPPFVDWQAHRGLVDRALARSLGVPVRTDGRIEVRLLPSPRLRVDRLHLGGDPDRPSLDARFVKAEIALAPLLKGEFRFTETRIGRAEIKLPVAGPDTLKLPPDFGGALRDRDLAIENLQIQQFLVTTQVPATGRTDQLYVQDLRLQAPALVGPWRIEGTSGGIPFRAASGTPGPDGRLAAKISGGGDATPRFEADARFGLVPAEAGGAQVEAEGSARLVVGPPTQAAGAYLPFSLAGTFKARGTQVRFEAVDLAIDPGGRALRLGGTGRLDLRQWRAGLTLDARRLDLDAFLASAEGQNLIARGLPRSAGSLPAMLDLDLTVGSAVLGGEEWSNLALTGTLERAGGLLLRRFAVTGPAESAVTASGQVETAPLRFSGPVALAAPDSEALGRYLRRLGAEGPLVALLDGRKIEAAADLSAAGNGLSLRNMRLGLGPARITGNARYTAAEGAERGRFEAQIRATGLDIAGLPPLGTALGTLRDTDLALTLEAKDVRFGATGSGTGTIAARIQSDGAGLTVDSLDVTDLAGASARLSGQIGADGTGRVSGRLKAPAAAPLLGLLERVWVGEIRLLPAFLRDAPLDLAVTLDREGGAAAALRTQARGSAGGGSLDLTLASRGARIEGGTATLAAPRAGAWFGRTDIAGLQQPAELHLTAERPDGQALALTANGTVAGLRLATGRPILVGPDFVPTAGTLRADTADLAPFLTLAGAATLAPGAWPADLAVTLSRQQGEAAAALAGTVAGAGVNGTLLRAAGGALHGRLALDRLSIPQLAAALVIPPGANGTFGPPATHPALSLDARVASLDLGRGLVATDATAALGLADAGLTLRDLTGKLAGGRLAGSVTIARLGSGASVSVSGSGSLDGAALPTLAGGPFGGRLSADLRFAATAETLPGLADSLSGSGALTLTDLSLPAADPAALGRALARAAEMDDPLREGRLQALVTEELARGGAQTRGSARAAVTIVGGVLRAGPFDLDLGPARWAGTVGYDLRAGRLDARGTLVGGPVPRGWNAGPPAVQFGLTGPLGAPERVLDVGTLSNGLAAFVLQRELETIELTEADQVERQRRRNRIEMDKARAAALKAAAEKAAADRTAADKAAEEAARRPRNPEEGAAQPQAPAEARP